MIVTFFSVYMACSSVLKKFLIAHRMLNLCRAIRGKDIETVRSILLKNPELVNLQSTDFLKAFFYSPMFTALLAGHKEIIELLIDLGADVGERLYFDFTYLHIPSLFQNWESNEEIAELLIQRGADVNACAYDRSTMTSPLQGAIFEDHLEYAEFLLKNGARLEGPEWDKFCPMDSVLESPKGKQAELLKLLIKYGLDTRYLSTFGEDYLNLTLRTSIICDIEVLEIVKILLDSGISANILNQDDAPPLFFATILKNTELMSLLIENGADVNFKSENCKGYFPLIFAIDNNNEDVVELLLSRGADINAKNENGCTALHFAIDQRLEKIIKLLLKEGALISLEDNEGWTPLSYLNPNDESDYPYINIMIKEMAKRNFLSASNVSQTDRDLILNHRPLIELFQKCMFEIIEMSKTNFYASYSYHWILEMRDVKKLANLTKNKDFVLKFEENLHEFPNYEIELRKNFEEATQFRDRLAIVISRLDDLFDGLLPAVVTRKLSENLTVEDLPLQ